MDFDASVPNAARVYDFFLGGKDNYAADRELTGASAQFTPRPFEDIARFFDGLELIDPGLVNVMLWRPELPPHQPPHAPRRSLIYGGVGLKP